MAKALLVIILLVVMVTYLFATHTISRENDSMQKAVATLGAASITKAVLTKSSGGERIPEVTAEGIARSLLWVPYNMTDPRGNWLRIAQYEPLFRKFDAQYGFDQVLHQSVCYIESSGNRLAVVRVTKRYTVFYREKGKKRSRVITKSVAKPTSCGGLLMYAPSTARNSRIYVLDKLANDKARLAKAKTAEERAWWRSVIKRRGNIPADRDWSFYANRYLGAPTVANAKAWTRVDDRLVPEIVIKRSAQQLAKAQAVYGDSLMAVQSWHCGGTNLYKLKKLAGVAGRKTSWAELTLRRIDPKATPAAYSYLYRKLKDKSWRYAYSVLAASLTYRDWKGNRAKYNADYAFYRSPKPGRGKKLVLENRWYRAKMPVYREKDIASLVDKGYLAKIKSSATVEIKPGVRPYLHPDAKAVVERLAKDVQRFGGGKLRITDAFRTAHEQDEFSSAWGPHRLGLAVDLSIATQAKRLACEQALYLASGRGEVAYLLEKDHFHVSIAPRKHWYHRERVELAKKEAAPVKVAAVSPKVVEAGVAPSGWDNFVPTVRHAQLMWEYTDSRWTWFSVLGIIGTWCYIRRRFRPKEEDY
jgi:hypothetical protein